MTIKKDRVYREYCSLPGFMLQWHITARCNQSCRHCYITSNPELFQRELTEELLLADCKKIINSLIDFCKIANAYPAVNFTGGDPLLHPHFFEILEYAFSKGIVLKVMGNPYHLTADNIERMKKLNVKSYQVSLDGMEEMHDWLRKNGSFRSTIEAIKLLKKCGMRTVVMFTLSKKNAKDIFDVIRLVSSLGVDVFAFARLARDPSEDKRFTGGAEEITPFEYRELLLKIQKQAEELKLKGCETQINRKDHLWKLLLYEQGKFKLTVNQNQQIISGCHVGRSNLTILANGTVFACRRFFSPIGKMPDQSVLEVFVSKKLNFYRHLEKFEKCSRCPLLCYCRGCPAVAYGSSKGDFYAPDPHCWRNND